MAKQRKPKNLKAVQAAKARKKRRNRRRKRAIVLAIEVIILLALSCTAFVMAKYDKFQRVEIDSDDIKINSGVKMEGYTTVALFGGDSREGQLEAGARTDTIIIAVMDHKNKQIRMASIYRDTLLQQENNTYNKANAAYSAGGPKAAINMLNKNLDLDIKDYVTVDFKAMSDVVDLLGGIKIQVTDTEAKMMNKYVRETARVSKKKAHKLKCGGVYTLDGPQAVTYARLRKLEGGDYKRTERQRLVIKKLYEKGIKTDVATMNKIIDKVFPQISTSFSLKDVLSLAATGISYKLGDSQGFPFEKTDGIMYPHAGDCVVALGLAENVEELHKFLYPEETKTVSSTVQTISNEISNLTNVVRPANLESETTKEEEQESNNNNKPVITNSTSGSGSNETGTTDGGTE